MSNKPIEFDGNEKLISPAPGALAPSPWRYLDAHEQHKNCTYLGGLFLELTRMAWSAREKFMSETSQTIRWAANDPNSIAIDLEYNFSGTQKESPTLIGVKLGEIKHSRVKGSNLDGLVGYDRTLEGYSYGRVSQGSVSFIHIGQSSGQSVDMADGTEEFYTVFGPAIANTYGFIACTVDSRFPLSDQPRELYGKARYASVVTVSFIFETSWHLKVENPKLMEIYYSSGQSDPDRYNIGIQ